MAQFFVSCPLHFEENLVKEIKSFWFEMMDLDGLPTREPLPEFVIDVGGIELKCPEHLGYQLNFFSKIAHRVLIRIHRFPARFYDQFEKEMKVLALAKWIAPGPLSLKIETGKSRLNHERNLIESSTRALSHSGYHVTSKAEGVQQLFVRIFRDQAVISLDTSGEHLHRRGYAIYRGEAPLRENLAAILSQQIYLENKNPQEIVFVDPFAGSGTMLFETASFMEPNFKRNFSWLQFLNKPKMFSSKTWSKNYRWLDHQRKFEMLAIDSDEHSISNIQKNAELFSEIYPAVNINLKTLMMDSQRLQKDQIDSKKQYWIISNPPYGHRLLQDSVTEIFMHLEDIMDLSGAIVLHPESLSIRFNHLKLRSEIDFANQGLNIKMSLFKN